MSALWAMAVKDLRLLLRDRAGVFLTFVWPLVLASFFGALGPGFGGPRSEIEVAVVDEDGSDESRAFAAALLDDASIETRVVKDVATAEREVVAGEVVAYVRLPAGFARDMEGPDAQAKLEIAADPRRVAETELLRGALAGVAYAQLSERRDAPASPLALTQRQVRSATASRPPSPYSVTFPQGMLWAVIACAATFGISLITERNSGTMTRLFVAPLSKAQVLGGKALACAVCIIGMQTILLLVSVIGFGVAPLSWPLLAAAIVSVTIGFVGVMMLLSVLARRSQSAAGISWAVLMVLAMVGGGMLPLFLMPPWLQTVAKLSPVSWGILALEGAIWRGFDAPTMLLHCGALVGLGVVCFTLGAARFRHD